MGMGPGMMGGSGMGPGMGPGMMGGSGMGYGMGPGMMGGWGPGPGMGPGMMGGWGMGYGMAPGMMGDCGYGMGSGYAMGHGRTRGAAGLDFSEQQRAQIAKIQKETRSRHWEQMSKLHQEFDALYDLYDAEPQNAQSIGEQYKKVSELRRQMLVSSIEAHNRLDAVLTKEQKAKLREQRPGAMMWGY